MASANIPKHLRALAAVLLVCIVGAGANYYLDLGWFGRHGKQVYAVTVLLCILSLFWPFRVPARLEQLKR